MPESSNSDPQSSHLDDIHDVIAQIVMQMARKVTQLRKESESGCGDIPKRVQETALHLSQAIDRLETRIATPENSAEQGSVQVEQQQMLSKVQDLRVFLHSELAAVLETEKTSLPSHLASSLAALIAAENAVFPEPSLN